MKKIIYIYALFLCFACADKASNTEAIPTEAENEHAVDNYDFNGKTLFKFDEKSANFQYDTHTNIFLLKNTITQKLQEFYDLQLLLQQYPEFKEEISSQLDRFGAVQKILPDHVTAIKIKEIEFIGMLTQLNDSTFSQKLLFSKALNTTQVKKDSIAVIIHLSRVNLDDKENINTLFTFTKL